MALDVSASVDESDWVSISELARHRGVTKQAISQRVKSLSRSGRLAVRGEGRALRIHRPTFEEIARATHDPAQDLRNRNAPAPQPPMRVEPAPAPIPGAQVETAYDSASAREKLAKAELAEMQLAVKRGELVEASTIEAAAIETATAVAQSIAALKSRFGRLYAAAIQGGEEGFRIEFVASIDEALAEIGEKMTAIAASE